MPFADAEKKKLHDKKYGASWYQRNSEHVKAAVKARKQRTKAEWQEYKATLACNRCGASHPAIIDFHHTDQAEKEHNIFRLVSNGAYKKAHEEIKKCEVLCANCHRIEHFVKRTGVGT